MRWGRILAVASAVLLAVAAGAFAFSQAGRARVGAELQRAHAPAEVAAFYAARGNRPLWSEGPAFLPAGALRPEAGQMAQMVAEALPGEVSDASRRQVAAAMADVQARRGGAAPRAEVALSVALADYLRTLQVGPGGVRLAFTDPDFKRPAGLTEAMDEVASAPSLAERLTALKSVNPVYQSLRSAYDAQRAKGPVPNAPLIVANLQRARLLPAPTANRFIVVNPAAGQLWMYENGQAVQSMKVVVGKRNEQTPMMAGLLRYMVFNPYWDIPVDLVRSSTAKKVLAGGVGAFKAQHLQALSDWSDDAVEVDPTEVDWKAVAAGRQELRVRQLPGGDNMMGGVKFMLPNELGIYLHDTPDHGAFGAPQRLLSAGCVRLERAHDLATWLLGGRMASGDNLGSDTKVDLDAAVPVYITYLTAQAGPDGKIVTYPDVYGRDPPNLRAS